MRLPLFLLLTVISGCLVGQVRLNEAVNSNSTIEDNDGDTPDWFELYNAGADQDLSGWTVTDDEDEPAKWRIGELTIGEGEYLLFWASGKDRPYDPAAGSGHTNFKLNRDGETLLLFDATGSLVDRLLVAGIPPDVSIGIPPGGGEAVVFGEPTPGSANPPSDATGVITEPVRFSRPSGRYGAFELRLSGAPTGGTIRYTTDGVIPTATSTLYTGPVGVDDHVVIRARTFAPGRLPSPVATCSYIIDDAHELDVVSLVTEPDNFFSGEDGIYVLGDGYTGTEPPFHNSNIWQDREVPVFLDFLPLGDGTTFSQDLGTKVFGGWSRSNDQRSLSLFARNRYGRGSMDYPFFTDRPYTNYEALILRNSGNDWAATMMADATMTGLMEGSAVDVQAYRPVATYLNGEYWGLYNLREKVNEHFIAARHSLDPDSIDILERNAEIVEGSNVDYLALRELIATGDLTDSATFSTVANQIDLTSFTQFNVAQIYFDNRDWPGNNLKFWRAQRPGAKWRYVLFDTDFGAGIYNREAYEANTLKFALETDGPVWPNPPWSTLILRRLLGNDSYRRYFINQFADEMNTRFLPEAVHALANRNADRIATEMPTTMERWQQYRDWWDHIDRLRRYFTERPRFMRQFIQEEFDLPAVHSAAVAIDDTTRGYVELNSLEIVAPEWVGDYFQGVPIRVKAVPKSGYQFHHWEGDAVGRPAEFTVDLERPSRFVAVFNPDSRRGQPGQLRDVAQLRVGPNPLTAGSALLFTALRDTRVRAQLYDISGRYLQTVLEATFSAGARQAALRVADLPRGAYVLVVSDIDGNRTSLRLIK